MLELVTFGKHLAAPLGRRDLVAGGVRDRQLEQFVATRNLLDAPLARRATCLMNVGQNHPKAACHAAFDCRRADSAAAFAISSAVFTKRWLSSFV
jgi:hypothetical protein